MSGEGDTFSVNSPEEALGHLLEGRPMPAFIQPSFPGGSKPIAGGGGVLDYKPKYEHGIANPNAGTDPTQVGGLKPWTKAPATSHIHDFRYDDVRDTPFLKKFPGLIGKGRSELHVRFKGKDAQGIAAHYVYFFDDPEQGKAVAELMAGSPHPMSEVLWPHVIEGDKVPYTRVA